MAVAGQDIEQRPINASALIGAAGPVTPVILSTWSSSSRAWAAGGIPTSWLTPCAYHGSVTAGGVALVRGRAVVAWAPSTREPTRGGQQETGC
jgi:hypothetical protein